MDFTLDHVVKRMKEQERARNQQIRPFLECHRLHIRTDVPGAVPVELSLPRQHGGLETRPHQSSPDRQSMAKPRNAFAASAAVPVQNRPARLDLTSAIAVAAPLGVDQFRGRLVASVPIQRFLDRPTRSWMGCKLEKSPTRRAECDALDVARCDDPEIVHVQT